MSHYSDNNGRNGGHNDTSILLLNEAQAARIDPVFPSDVQDKDESSLASRHSMSTNVFFVLLHLVFCYFYIYGQTSQYAATSLYVSNMETGRLIEEHTVHKFTLWSNIKMYWDDGIYVLALLCGFTSIPMPHLKILFSIWLWFYPMTSKSRRLKLSLQEQSNRWLLASNVVSGYTASSFFIRKEFANLKVEVISLPSPGFWFLIVGSILMLLLSHLILTIHDRLEAKVNPRHLRGLREISWSWALVLVIGVFSFTGSLFFISFPIVNSELHDFLGVDDMYELTLLNFGTYGVAGNDNITQRNFLITLDFWLYVLSPILSTLFGFIYAYKILSKGAGRHSNRILEILSASSSLDVYWVGIVLSAYYAIVLSDTLMDSIDFCHKLDVSHDVKCFTVSGNVYASAWLFFPFIILQRIFLTYLISVF